MYHDTYMVGNIVKTEYQHFFVNSVITMRIPTFSLKCTYCLYFEKKTSNLLYCFHIEQNVEKAQL